MKNDFYATVNVDTKSVCVCVDCINVALPINKRALPIVVEETRLHSSLLSLHLQLTGHLTGLPYYAGVPGVPSAFQYGPTVFVPPASAKQPAMGLANPSNQYHQQHQPSYGQHAYGTGKTRTKQGGAVSSNP